MKRLILVDTAIDDAAASHLKAIVGLARLELQGTKVTDTGLRELRAAIPGILLEK